MVPGEDLVDGPLQFCSLCYGVVISRRGKLRASYPNKKGGGFDAKGFGRAQVLSLNFKELFFDN